MKIKFNYLSNKNEKILLICKILTVAYILLLYYIEFKGERIGLKFYLPYIIAPIYFFVSIYKTFNKKIKDKCSILNIVITSLIGFVVVLNTGGLSSTLKYFFPIYLVFSLVYYGFNMSKLLGFLGTSALIILWLLEGVQLSSFIFDLLPLFIIVFLQYLVLRIRDSELKVYYEKEFLFQKDPTTNLYDYRCFKKLFDQEVFKAKNENYNFAIYLIDIKDLQNMNEVIGYTQTNNILRQVSNVLLQSKAFDHLFTYKGGCFIAFEKVRNFRAAAEKAAVVENLIANYPFINKKELLKNVRVNVGWAVYPFEGSNQFKLEVRANEKLNKAKRLQRQEELEYKNRMEKLSLIGQLAAGFAHEIRNPLTTVQGFCQLVKEMPENKQNAQYMKIVIEELKRVNSLLNDFLNITKTNKAKLEKTSVKNFFEDLIKIVSPELLFRDIEFKINVRDNCPDIIIDKTKMTQVFLNLILNAVDAVSPKKGKIKIDCYANSASQVIIDLKDNGKGIDEDQISKIFEPFYSDKENGTGLGLPISHKIVEAHGGEIRVKSEKGRGTKFTLILPSYNRSIDNVS